MPPTRREFLSTAAAASIASTVGTSAGQALGAVLMQSPATAADTAKLTIRADEKGAMISRHIYGHFAEHLGRCIYDGIWVGPDSPIPNINGFRKDIVEALKALKIPNLRWPGGCFADDYHWRDGIGPRASRPRTVNIHWGNNVEDNSFGTHEFLDLCELLETDAYVAFNLGSGTPAEMRQWLEYMTFDGDSTLANERRKNGREKPWKVPFVGIGNENWGCGGNMTPEYYADLHNQFNVYCREFSGNKMTRVACGVNGEDYNWAEVVLKNGRGVQGLSWHYYTVWPTWNHKGAALSDRPDHWIAYMSEANKLSRILEKGEAIFDAADPTNRIGIYFDEWGTWHATEKGDTALYQQNTIRDALVASLSLDIFHRHAKRVRMANIAQVVNVLQSMILTEVGGQNRMILTPTYHVFEMYKVHMDATSVPVDVAAGEMKVDDKVSPTVSSSASINSAGVLHLNVSNLNADKPITVSAELKGITAKTVTGRILSATTLNAHNDFDHPDAVKPAAFTDAKISNGTLTATLPARSVVVLALL